MGDENEFADLPAVEGRMCEWSLNEFERRARIRIQREQERPLPDNALTAVLCNAVRLKREHADRMTATLNKVFSG